MSCPMLDPEITIMDNADVVLTGQLTSLAGKWSAVNVGHGL